MRYLASAMRLEGTPEQPKIVLSHGATEIVALMFKRGCTVHVLFCISIVANDDGTYKCKPEQ